MTKCQANIWSPQRESLRHSKKNTKPHNSEFSIKLMETMEGVSIYERREMQMDTDSQKL